MVQHQFDIFSYSTTTEHGGINFMKSRNNTVGTIPLVTTGDVIFKTVRWI